MLTFWPFCFMPCLFPPPTKEFLHCSVCEFRFGQYDRQTGRAVASHESLLTEDTFDTIRNTNSNQRVKHSIKRPPRNEVNSDQPSFDFLFDENRENAPNNRVKADSHPTKHKSSKKRPPRQRDPNRRNEVNSALPSFDFLFAEKAEAEANKNRGKNE